MIAECRKSDDQKVLSDIFFPVVFETYSYAALLDAARERPLLR